MRIAVMGSGGLGGYFGARLVQGGADVHFVARGKHLEAMRRAAQRRAYDAVDQVAFDGMQFRRDIGHRALAYRIESKR